MKDAALRDGARIVLGWTAIAIAAETLSVWLALVAFSAPWIAVVAVAALEPVLLGAGQTLLLRATHPALARGWFVATLAGAILGRCAEYLVDADVIRGLPAVVQPGVLVACGALVGALMAGPQALALARTVEHAWIWVAARAFAWAIALPSLLLAVAGAAIAHHVAAARGTVTLDVVTSCAIIGAFTGLVEGTAIDALSAFVRRSGATR
jgi:hypothetical protein